VIPNRFNDTTVVEIGFYLNDVRVLDATQFLHYRVDRDFELTKVGTAVDNGDNSRKSKNAQGTVTLSLERLKHGSYCVVGDDVGINVT